MNLARARVFSSSPSPVAAAKAASCMQLCNHQVPHRFRSWLGAGCAPGIQSQYTGAVRLLSCSVPSRSQHFGQPLASSHPHILKQGDLSPGVTCDEYKQRRSRLVQRLTKAAPSHIQHHIVAMVSAKQLHSGPDVPYEFRQCADYRYLCGFLEAESVLLIEWSATDETCHTVIFAGSRSGRDRLWHGPRTSLSAIPAVFGVDKALPVEQLTSYLCENYPDSRKKQCMLWHTVSPKASIDEALNKQIKSHFSNISPVSNVLPHLHSLRVSKTTAELELMRKAATATHAGFLKMMKRSDVPVGEWTLEERLHSGFMDESNGVSSVNRVQLAFPSVIAGGCRATVLHYLAKDMRVGSSDLVLVDAGAEVHGYVCDVSRTWPLSGRYTPCQRVLYDIVVQVQSNAIGMIDAAAESGTPTSMQTLYDASLEEMKDLMRSNGVIRNSASASETSAVVKRLFPHALGHYVGADVHDCKFVPESAPLREGVTMTIEPGVYIPADNAPACVPSCFHGIGVRVEDIVVINAAGRAELLTSTARTSQDIEDLLNNTS
ncbi:xaa-Pro aminopeptidase 3-like [Sycon ciliatum]|uniref:xaa-Pro aminopeptidase 3-like n=1 Tax=Sycon ciliatum TaxID=27933 RepID=UPI0020A8CAE0|eukprot:scpid63732/ scgid33479/ Probable Xaa-Pro aminopeptidase 3; Aminopeptidase P3